MSIPTHPQSQEGFHLPDEAGKELISHAIRNVPNAKRLLSSVVHQDRNVDVTQGQPQHEYKGGALEWAYLNR